MNEQRPWNEWHEKKAKLTQNKSSSTTQKLSKTNTKLKVFFLIIGSKVLAIY